MLISSHRAPVHESYRCEVARTPYDLESAARLVEEVYAQSLGLDARLSARAPAPDRAVICVKFGGEVVATLTLQSAGFAPTFRSSGSLDVSAHYDLGSLPFSSLELAEISRIAVAKGHSHASDLLYRFAGRHCAEAGVSRWIGLVDAGDPKKVDRPGLYRVLLTHGLVVRPWPLAPAPCARWSSAELHRLLRPHDCRLPSRIRAFARRLGALGVSLPSRHPDYDRLVLPMIAQVDDVACRTIQPGMESIG